MNAKWNTALEEAFRKVMEEPQPEHDPWCSLVRGRGPCSCRADAPVQPSKCPECEE
jgi:hypothetical protein